MIQNREDSYWKYVLYCVRKVPNSLRSVGTELEVYTFANAYHNVKYQMTLNSLHREGNVVELMST